MNNDHWQWLKIKSYISKDEIQIRQVHIDDEILTILSLSFRFPWLTFESAWAEDSSSRSQSLNGSFSHEGSHYWKNEWMQALLLVKYIIILKSWIGNFLQNLRNLNHPLPELLQHPTQKHLQSLNFQIQSDFPENQKLITWCWTPKKLKKMRIM